MRILAAVLLTSSAAFPAPPPGSASAAVKAANDRVLAALDRYFKAQGAEKQKAREEARNAVGALLDFESLSRAVLGRHWNQLRPEQRARFTAALRGAMEANYLSKMKQGEVDISKVRHEILGETRQGDKVLVKTRVVSGSDSAEVDYLLERGKKGWRAVDVITEGVSLVETYREQVNRLLPKKGIEGVIQALERAKKRAEQEQDKPASAAAPAAAEK